MLDGQLFLQPQLLPFSQHTLPQTYKEFLRPWEQWGGGTLKSHKVITHRGVNTSGVWWDFFNRNFVIADSIYTDNTTQNNADVSVI